MAAPLVVTMRTPGEDEELALGFLYGEGLLDGARAAGPPEDLAGNIVEVDRPAAPRPDRAQLLTSSSCGVCGKGALEEVAVVSEPVPDGPEFDRALAGGAPGPAQQPTFERTGGLHATGLFTDGSSCACARTSGATTRWTRWSAGRSGRACAAWPHVLCVSGRLSFELVQKAAVAGAPVLVGVGAPTSLAVGLAADRRMTLCGFARDGRVTSTRERSGCDEVRCGGADRGRGRVGRCRRTGSSRAHTPVNVTINGQTWESSVAAYGGRFYLPLRRGYPGSWRGSSPVTRSA